ncbi:rhomboid family intramembrane serine protease [Algirhabdus cladophorae]|uniref:rhomboid family intramembrane serine protease n=1 Tax=Algirhabdus cladophorae TaxID=3377108 RepID=UPI003B847B1D
MQQPPNTTAPFNPLPPVVVALAAVLAVIEIALSLAERGILGGAQGIGWRTAAVQDYGFYGVIVQDYVERGVTSGNRLMRFVSYPFVHLSFTSAIFSIVFILALGNMVGRVFRPVAVLVIFFAASIFGALAYGAFTDLNFPLVGAFPGAYGLIGAFTYLLWLRLGQMGAQQLRAFSLIGFLMGFQLVFGLLFGSDPSWVADIAGFVIGLILSPLVRPGGLGELIRRIRRD